MNPAVRAANAFDSAVFRAASVIDAFERHDTPLPASYPATLRSVQRHADSVTKELPGLIDAVADRLSPASAERWRSCAALAASSGDVAETVAIVRVLSPLLARRSIPRLRQIRSTAPNA